MSRVSFSALISSGRAQLAVLGEGIEPAKESRLGSYVTMAAGRPLGFRSLWRRCRRRRGLGSEAGAGRLDYAAG
jgi:hypothetical protein